MQQHTYTIMRQVEDTHWWFAGRRQLIQCAMERVLETVSTVGRHRRILDVGCGTGKNLEMLARYGDCEGIDISQDALEFCHERGLRNVQLGTVEHLPFPSESFDIVTALDVIEHLQDDCRALREIGRVLRPGGCLLMFVPAFMFLWGVQDDISHHLRRYRLPELRAVAQSAGLQVRWDSYANITFFVPILAARLFMWAMGLRVASENNINLAALNGTLATILGSERVVLRHGRIPVGVSAISIVQRPS